MENFAERICRLESFQSRLVELKALEAEEEEKMTKMREEEAKIREERLRRREEVFGARLQELSCQADATQLMVQEMRVEAEQVVLLKQKQDALLQKVVHKLDQHQQQLSTFTEFMHSAKALQVDSKATGDTQYHSSTSYKANTL